MNYFKEIQARNCIFHVQQGSAKKRVFCLQGGKQEIAIFHVQQGSAKNGKIRIQRSLNNLVAEIELSTRPFRIIYPSLTACALCM